MLSGLCVVTMAELAATLSVPNKPMVLTALITTEERSLGSVRQHIGEPLGSRDGQRATSFEEQTSGHEQ